MFSIITNPSYKHISKVLKNWVYFLVFYCVLWWAVSGCYRSPLPLWSLLKPLCLSSNHCLQGASLFEMLRVTCRFFLLNLLQISDLILRALKSNRIQIDYSSASLSLMKIIFWYEQNCFFFLLLNRILNPVLTTLLLIFWPQTASSTTLSVWK